MIKGIHVLGAYADADQNVLIARLMNLNLTHIFATTLGWEPYTNLQGEPTYTQAEMDAWITKLKDSGLNVVIGCHACQPSQLDSYYAALPSQINKYEPDGLMLPEIPFTQVPYTNPYDPATSDAYIDMYMRTYELIEYAGLPVYADLGMWNWSNFVGETLEINEANLAQYAPWKAYLTFRQIFTYIGWNMLDPIDYLYTLRTLKMFERANSEPHTCKLYLYDWGLDRSKFSNEEVAKFVINSFQIVSKTPYLHGATWYHFYAPCFGADYRYNIINDDLDTTLQYDALSRLYTPSILLAAIALGIPSAIFLWWLLK